VREFGGFFEDTLDGWVFGVELAASGHLALGGFYRLARLLGASTMMMMDERYCAEELV
jgi:hypothetical protein